MFIRLDPQSGIPLYMQIINQVRQQVAGGVLASGDRLPSVRELALQLRINPNTVARAYRELRHDELLTSQWGDGNFISAEAAVTGDKERVRIVSETLDSALKLAADMRMKPSEIAELLEERLRAIREVSHEDEDTDREA